MFYHVKELQFNAREPKPDAHYACLLKPQGTECIESIMGDK